MKDPNANKNRWVILVGKPKLDHPNWKDSKPTPDQMVEVWYGQVISSNCSVSDQPFIYSTKTEAIKAMKQLPKAFHAYELRVEKHNPRKKHP